MPLQLPPAIDRYLSSEKSGDTKALADCFAPDAVVRDEGHVHEGLDAIRAWKIEAKRKYDYTVAPLAVSEQNGRTVVTARVTGTFPGSPATLKLSFGLDAGKIGSLQIG